MAELMTKTLEVLVKMGRTETMVLTEHLEFVELMTMTMVLAEHMEMTGLLTKTIWVFMVAQDSSKPANLNARVHSMFIIRGVCFLLLQTVDPPPFSVLNAAI